MKKKIAFVVVVLFFIVGFLLPNTNPSVENEVVWDSPRTKEVFNRACLDCHSHETKWPWYTHVAPAAFLVKHNVHEAREHFNISLKNMGEAYEAAHEVEEGEMPPNDYLLLHPEAKLSEAEKSELIVGLKKTFGEKGEKEEGCSSCSAKEKASSSEGDH